MTDTNLPPTPEEVIGATMLSEISEGTSWETAAASTVRVLAERGYRIVKVSAASAIEIELGDGPEWPVAFTGLIERGYLVGIIGYDGEPVEEYAMLTAIDRDPADGFEVLCFERRDPHYTEVVLGDGRARIDQVSKVVIY